MSNRSQRLATDWKTYVALLAALASLLEAITGLFTKVAQLSEGAAHLPIETRWIAVALLAVVAVIALLSALSRRSILLRPERFVVSADDPRFLVGRDDDLNALVEACETSPLVFLTGESGAGKSALVQAGLLSHYRDIDNAHLDSAVFVPILIDASSLSWKDGLRTALSRALRSLSDSHRNQIGATDLNIPDVFELISKLPRDATSRLLIIFDQIDDYITAHRTHFIQERRVVSSEEIEKNNADWGAFAKLVREGTIHILVVCRADAVGTLDSLRFADPITILLPRVDEQLIRPLLDRVSDDDGKGQVIEDPDYGWIQLKSRLLRDLSAGGDKVLPVQLAVALDSLRRFPYLTLTAYRRCGGIRGLERLHITRHLQEAAKMSRIDDTLLLRGLLCLVSEDGSKTRRVTRERFCTAIEGADEKKDDLEAVLEHFERQRILRRQPSGEDEYLLLHHDYLARGIREAFRYTNRWAESLRERGAQFEGALNFQQRWRALLPISTQVFLLWARIKRRFVYGQYRYFAFWSLLRLLPAAMILAALIYGYCWEVQRRQDLMGQRIVAGINPQDTIDVAEANDWRELAMANAHARLDAVRTVLSAASIASKTHAKAQLLIHVVIGLDPDGDLSRQLVQEIIVPALRQPEADTSIYRAAGELSRYLRLSNSVANELCTTLVVRMADAQPDESRLVADLTKVLVLVSDKLTSKDVKPMAAMLVARMCAPSTDTKLLAEFGEALGGLSDKLEPKDVESGAAVLVSRMKSLQPSEISLMTHLAEALSSLKDKLSNDAARNGVTVLMTRMTSASWDENGDVWRLGDALGGLKDRLNSEDARQFAAALADRMTSAQPNEGEYVADLGRVLGSLQDKYGERDEAVLGATALVDRMTRAQPNENKLVANLGSALGFLTEKLKERDDILLRGASILTTRMKSGQVDNPRLFVQFAGALGTLHKKLSGEDLLTGLVAWVERITSPQADGDADTLVESIRDYHVAEHLASKLRSEDALPLVEAVVQKIKNLRSDHEILLLSLNPTLKSLAGKLQSADAERLAEDLVERIGSLPQDDWRDTSFLEEIGKSLQSLTDQLGPEDSRKLATAIDQRMMRVQENDGWVVAELGDVLATLREKLNKRDDILLRCAAALTDRMKRVQLKEPSLIVRLGRALGNLSDKLDPTDVRDGIVTLFAQIHSSQPIEVSLLAELGEALAGFKEKLSSAELRAGAAVLSASLTRVCLSEFYSEDDLEGLARPLDALGEKLESKDAQPILADLGLLINNTHHDLSALIGAWCTLETAANADRDPQKRVEAYVNLLKLPFMIGYAQNELLSGLETLTSKNFDGNLWNFVDWVTQSEKGKGYRLNLENPRVHLPRRRESPGT